MAAQGCKKDNTKETINLFSIHPNQLPKNIKPTYLLICVKYLPQKEDTYHVRLTVGVNIVHYQGETYAPTAHPITSDSVLDSYE